VTHEAFKIIYVFASYKAYELIGKIINLKLGKEVGEGE